MARRFLPFDALALACAMLAGCGGSEPHVVAGAPWAGHDSTIILDHHTHSSDSDGALSPPELIATAIDNGCDAIALTDHTDAGASASGEQFAVVAELRRNHPDLILLHGLEVNMPSYGGREHATLLVHPDLEPGLLPQVKERAELSLNGGETADRQLLGLLSAANPGLERIVLIYNHPSRQVARLAESMDNLRAWNAAEPFFVAIEGAPGHQKASVPGDYRGSFPTQSRWDPLVTEVGGGWDRLLGEGLPVWGALAGSDFHNRRLDEAPCAFSRTHVAAPDRSAAGILRGLRAGTFWADHGRMLSRFRLTLDVVGSGITAFPGDELDLNNSGVSLLASVDLVRDVGAIGKELTVEYVTNCAGGESVILARQTLPPQRTLAMTPLPVAGEVARCYLRARVLLRSRDETLFAHSNPIRLRV